MKITEHGMEPSRGQFLVYEAPDGELKLDVRLEDETVWLTQQLMAELDKQVVVRKFRTTTLYGSERATDKKFLSVQI